MKILKWGILGALIAQVIYLFTKDAKLKKEIEKSQGRKKAQILGKEIVDLNKDLVKKAQQVNYEKKRDNIKHIAQAKEKDLQKQVKKLQSYTDSLGDKKVKDIVKDIKSSSEGFIKKIEKEAVSVKKSMKAKKKSVVKKASGKKAPSKKIAAKKKK